MIEVSVFANSNDFANNVCALRRLLDNESLHVPYEEIIRANKCLFGATAVIQFVCL